MAGNITKRQSYIMYFLMEGHTAIYEAFFSKKANLNLIKSLDPATNVQEIQRQKTY